MPDQKRSETQQDTKKDEQLKIELDVKAHQKNESDKLSQQQNELKQREEKKRKIELAEEMEKKREKDKKEKDELDRIKQEQAAESKRRYCSLCGKEFFPIRVCRCAAVGGGGGSGGSEGAEEQLNNEGNTPPTFVGKLFAMAGQLGSAIMQAIEGSHPDQKSHPLSKLMFNSDIISDLLSKKLLLIDNNRDSGILTIKLLCSPSMLSNEQRKELNNFFEAILKQLDEFKKEKGITTDCVKKENEGNIYISLPTPKMYDEFIKILTRKNLLPKQVIEQKEDKKAVFQEGVNHFNLTPFSTKLTYESSKKTNQVNEDLKKDKPSTIRPRLPSDGPKPK